MINHGYTPPEFIHSSMIPLPKGARADLSNSDMYLFIWTQKKKNEHNGIINSKMVETTIKILT